MRNLRLPHIVRMNSVIFRCFIPNCVNLRWRWFWWRRYVIDIGPLLFIVMSSLRCWCQNLSSVTNNGITQLNFFVEGSLCIFYRGTKITYFNEWPSKLWSRVFVAGFWKPADWKLKIGVDMVYWSLSPYNFNIAESKIWSSYHGYIIVIWTTWCELNIILSHIIYSIWYAV